MIVLGFHHDLDAGAVLVVDGELLGAVSEERFTRIKQDDGLPRRSIDYLLRLAGLSLTDVDVLAYGWLHGETCGALLPRLLERAMWNAGELEATAIIKERFEREFRKDHALRAAGFQELLDMGVPRHKISLVEHHSSHAWSAFAPSPFERALVVTADGRGDFKSFSVSEGDASGIREVDWLSTLDSLGHLYSQITHHLGFRANRHEGKITGLAAHGDPGPARSLMARLVTWKHGQIYSRIGRFYLPYDVEIPAALRAELDTFAPADLAAALQRHVEELVTRYVGRHLEARPHRNVCLAGGLFANVKLNQRIREIDGVENVYVQPCMGDGGTALGAALAVSFAASGEAKIEMPDVFLGPDFTNTEIGLALERFPDLSYRRIEDRSRLLCELLRAEKVIGLFEGRMEYGPRALGHRSILFHARDRSVNDWLNARLERTEFMPFAPAVLEELAGGCFEGWHESHVCARFMTMSYICTAEFRREHPAVVHVDGTARPQVITRRQLPDLYQALWLYHRETGQKAVINTSFNRHEEPIVCAPADALQGLASGMVDVLLIGNYLVEC